MSKRYIIAATTIAIGVCVLGYLYLSNAQGNQPSVNTASTGSIFDFYGSDIPKDSKTYIFAWLKDAGINPSNENIAIKAGSFKKTIQEDVLYYKHVDFIIDITEPKTSIRIINDIPLEDDAAPEYYQPPTILCPDDLEPAQAEACAKVAPAYE